MDNEDSLILYCVGRAVQQWLQSTMHYLLVTRREDGSVSIARFQEMLLIK